MWFTYRARMITLPTPGRTSTMTKSRLDEIFKGTIAGVGAEVEAGVEVEGAAVVEGEAAKAAVAIPQL